MTISDLTKMSERSPNGYKTLGKGEIARHEQISPVPTVFSKDWYCSHVKTRACLGKGNNSLPTDKILAWSKFKAITNDKINEIEKFKFV